VMFVVMVCGGDDKCCDGGDVCCGDDVCCDVVKSVVLMMFVDVCGADCLLW